MEKGDKEEITTLSPFLNHHKRDDFMITTKNKQFLFDLLFNYVVLNNNVDKLNQHITFLQKELSIIEGVDIASIDPYQFSDELLTEWKAYLDYRKRFL
jgi:hypothetical protein